MAWKDDVDFSVLVIFLCELDKNSGEVTKSEQNTEFSSSKGIKLKLAQ